MNYTDYMSGQNMNYDDFIPPGATNRFDNNDYPPGPRQEPEMAEATVIEPDDIFDRPVTAEAFQEYNFTDLTAKQIKKLSHYGAILDRLSPDQIAEVLAQNEYSPDGRAVIILPKKREISRNKTIRNTLDPNGKKSL